MNQPEPVAAVAVAAIRTAAGAQRVQHSGPDTKFCVLCLSGEHERVHGPDTAGAQQPEPKERRAQYAAAMRIAVCDDPDLMTDGEEDVIDDLTNAVTAVADEELRAQAFATARQLGELACEVSGLRAELEQARGTDLYFCPTAAEIESRSGGGFDTCCAHPDRHVDVPDVPGIHAVSEYLSAQARTTTGQDTTPPAEGEQEIRQQIADALEAADYRMDMRRGDLADAVLPVVRAAVAAVQEDLAFVHRVTIPELWREVERHADGKQRWRKRAEEAEAAVAAERGAVLTETIAAVEDREQRFTASGRDSLGWESARDVLLRMRRTAGHPLPDDEERPA